MMRPCWLRRAVRNRHDHAVEQASRRWRGGRRDDSAERAKILTSAQVRAGDARAQGPAAAPFRLAELTSKSVAGAHAIHV